MQESSDEPSDEELDEKKKLLMRIEGKIEEQKEPDSDEDVSSAEGVEDDPKARVYFKPEVIASIVEKQRTDSFKELFVLKQDAVQTHGTFFPIVCDVQKKETSPVK